MQSKIELRSIAKSVRKNLDITNVSNSIISNIRDLHEYYLAKHIMIFYPLASEINLLGLLEDDNKYFYLPRVNGIDLECCPYKRGDDLILSPLNIREPCCESVDKSEIELVFVPALMADNNFYRLGYGGGFYDRFLKDLNAFKIIPLADELIVESLPIEETDVKCDCIVTQKKASFGRG